MPPVHQPHPPPLDVAGRIDVAYVLFRFPEVSQTFVRDEVWGLRGAGLTVDVIVLDPPESQGDDDGWAGPYRQFARPTLTRAARDHLWWGTRKPMRYGGMLIRATTTPGRRNYMLRRLPSEARRWLGSEPRRFHTHFAWDTATVVAALGKLLGVPTSITVHAKDIYAQPARQVRARLDAFDRIVTVCHYNVGFMTGRGITAPGDPRVTMLPCVVDVPDANAPCPEPASDVVCVARLVEKKGVDVLLQAVAEMAGRGMQLRVVVVGEGPERGGLEALTRKLGIEAQVGFVGARSHAETLRTIAGAKVFCLPVRPAGDGDSDAMPVVLREAMARGVPVITTPLAGIPESVDSAVGWLVEAGDVPGLAAALDEAMEDPEGRERRGQAARARVEDRWTAATVMPQLAQLLVARTSQAGPIT